MHWAKGKKNITSMHPNEIRLYELYVEEAVRHGLKRGALPGTANLRCIVSRYNQEMNTSETENEVWIRLESVLKAGVKKIEVYLRTIRAAAAA
jgi:hypothetical protein